MEVCPEGDVLIPGVENDSAQETIAEQPPGTTAPRSFGNAPRGVAMDYEGNLTTQWLFSSYCAPASSGLFINRLR